jgi:aminomethyltransferase
MGRLRFEGARAHELLDYLLTRRVADMSVGTVRYALICNEQGGILDDVLVSCLESPSGRQFFLLVVNAGNRAKILKWIAPHVADYPDVMFRDATDDTAMIALQGPHAAAIAARLLPQKVLNLRNYRGLVTEQFGKPCIVSRTGYTGEDGYELIVRSEDAVRVWENLLLAGRAEGIAPVGLGARDTLRLEAGMPLYGHELSEQIDPYQAGLEFAVNLDSAEGRARQFIGADALQRKSQSTVAAIRMGLMLEGRRVAREGAELYDSDSRRVGQVTSGTFSPTLQRPIAMAYVAPAMAVPGMAVDVDIRGARVAGTISKLPLYARPRK